MPVAIRPTVPRSVLRHRRQRAAFHVAAIIILVAVLLFAVHWAGV
jgi:hypothetical protein